MKHILKFNENRPDSNENEEIVSWCTHLGIEKYTIDNGVVNVNGNVRLRLGKSDYKLPIKFGKVSGDFKCYNNSLITLEGSPDIVEGDFFCSGNNLTSLKGSPKKVGGDFDCSKNKLSSLIGCPKYIGGDIICYRNRIVSLEGIPNDFNGELSIHENPVFEVYMLVGNPRNIHVFNSRGILNGMKINRSKMEKYLKDANGERYIKEIDNLRNYEVV